MASTSSQSEARTSSTARAAGFAYLVTIAAGLFAEIYARGAISTNDPAQAAASLMAHATLYRLSILSDCVMILAYLIVTALLYRLFNPTSANASLVAALMSVVGLALLASGTATLLLPLPPGNAGQTLDALYLHGAVYDMTGFFFGAYCLLIGGLAMRSMLLPRLIGLLMSAAGLVFLADATLWLAAPQIEKAIPDAVFLVSLIGEGSLALWLSAFGVRNRNAEFPDA